MSTDAGGNGTFEFLTTSNLVGGTFSATATDAATGHRVIAQLFKANPAHPPEHGTGWHQHIADFHIVIMTKGWARFMYGDQEHLVEAGDCVHQQPGITHYLFDYSPDMEYLEITSPADFGTVDVIGPCPVPAAIPWPGTST